MPEEQNTDVPEILETAAIYARYSSTNQRETSIQDQVASCRRRAAELGAHVPDEFVFTDSAIAGSRRDRNGLNRLMAQARAGHFRTVFVDDLSRFSRDATLFGMLAADLEYQQVRIVSVADRTDSSVPTDRLQIQLRAVIAEQYQRDLASKTARGQRGQFERGFFLGSRTFGYNSVPMGEMRADRSGRIRPEGYGREINEEEAAVVREVFEMYISGMSVSAIAKSLNERDIKSSSDAEGTWSLSMVHRIFEQELYIGIATWSRTKSVKDRRTGRSRSVPRPREEWLTRDHPELRIVPQELWDEVQARRAKVSRSFPTRKGERGFGKQQRGSSVEYPASLLAGTLQCAECGHALGQVSGSHGGYFGCLCGHRSANCTNRLKVRRNQVESQILASVQDFIATPENCMKVLRRIQDELGQVNERELQELASRRRDLTSQRKRLDNLIGFVAEGRGTQALGAAIESHERTIQRLESEIELTEARTTERMKPPPKAWVADRLENLREVLADGGGPAALALRDVLGEVVMTPVSPDIGRDYYRATTSLDVIELVRPRKRSKRASGSGHEKGRPSGLEPEDGISEHGANTFRLWRRRESNPGPEAR